MKNYVTQIRILLGLSLLFIAGGFYIVTIRADIALVGIGLGVIGIGLLLATSALYPAIKMMQMQNEQKEARIKTLEDEVARLKKN